jgi:uncharacterized protein (TIGR00369 family)
VTSVADAAARDEFLAWFNELGVMRALGVRCTEAADGRAVSVLDVQAHHRNPSGAVNGGFLLAAADVTAGAAISSTGAASSATTDLSMHFLAAATEGPLTIEAEVLRRGRRSCVPSVRITDAGGELCAVATGTWVLRDA